MNLRILLLTLVFGLSLLPVLVAQESPAPTASSIPAGADSPDPANATRAWLDSVPADKRARSDAYFEGGYWLLLWNYLASAGISLFRSRFIRRSIASTPTAWRRRLSPRGSASKH